MHNICNFGSEVRILKGKDFPSTGLEHTAARPARSEQTDTDGPGARSMAAATESGDEVIGAAVSIHQRSGDAGVGGVTSALASLHLCSASLV